MSFLAQKQHDACLFTDAWGNVLIFDTYPSSFFVLFYHLIYCVMFCSEVFL